MITTILFPKEAAWAGIMQRPGHSFATQEQLVKKVFEEVRELGDEAIIKYTKEFDKVEFTSFALPLQSFIDCEKNIPAELIEAIHVAKKNIETFHVAQIDTIRKVETMPGVQCWRESRAIERVGLYIPGGSAPLFSTILMLGIPAQIAGCKEIILCTPPDKNGQVDPVILYTAKLVGIRSVFLVGGIQAIAGMAFGTQTIPKVDKIFGPGNQYVMAAKTEAMKYVAIDMPAGPSEVLVIADETAVPAFVAADLLAQAEHGPDSQVILLSTNAELIDNVKNEIDEQLKSLPRKQIIEQALQSSKCILLKDLKTCFTYSNAYAPEHLIMAIANPLEWIDEIGNAGSVFLGHYSPESAGDYASGTNHTLPTNGFAKSYSGVSLDSFVKKITFQEITKTGLKNIGRTIELMADAEQLSAHGQSVSLRLKELQ